MRSVLLALNYRLRTKLPSKTDVYNVLAAVFIKQLNNNKMEHNNERNITCPYCGWEDEDSWEFGEDEGTATCGSCEKEFNVTREIEVTYSTSRIECEEGEHNYKVEDYHIHKQKYNTKTKDWDKLPELEWEYIRIEVCDICEDKEYIKITKDEYTDALASSAI